MALMKRATIEERIANAKVERTQNALDAVSDMAIRLARNIPSDASVEDRIKQCINGLQAVLRDRQPLAGIKPAIRPIEEIRHLTFAACEVIDAVGLLMQAENSSKKDSSNARRPQGAISEH